MAKVQIEEIQTFEKKRRNPILVNFENQPPDEATFAHAFDLDKDQTPTLLVANDSHLYKGPIQDDPLLNTFVAIRNRSTNKIRLVQVEQANLISSIFDSPDNDKRVVRDAQKLLLKNFGSKAATRSLDRREKTRFNADTVKSELDTSVSKVDRSLVKEERPEDLKVNALEIRPPLNKNANGPADAYQLLDIIPKEIFEHLDEVAREVVKFDPDQLPFSTSFLFNTVKQVLERKMPDSEENLQKIKICIYMDSLVNLINSKKVARTELSKMSEKLENHIKIAFSQHTGTGTQLVKTRLARQKAICYYLVLAFKLSDELQINLADIVDGMESSKKEILTFAEFVGGKQKDKTDFVVLKKPTDAPAKPRKGFRKRR